MEGSASSSPGTSSDPDDGTGFLPAEPPRNRAESLLVRVVATGGVVAIGTALGTTLSATSVAAWINALVVSVVTVALAATLWRSRTL